MLKINLGDVEQIASECGLDVFGVIDLSQLEKALEGEKKHLKIWQERGFAGQMEYMKRSPDLFSSVKNFLPECRSVVSFSVNYLQQTPGADAEDPYSIPPAPYGYGRIARYAWGRDYHRVLASRLKKFAKNLESMGGLGGELRYRIFSDAVPLLERTVAKSAGLGFIGRNTLLIRPGLGSFSFLAEILLNVEIEVETKAPDSFSPGCGSCSRCLSACPTGALPESGVLNAERCISYLTIEKRSAFSEWEAMAVSDWLFGCDLCQEVCPFNHRGLQETKIKDFLARENQGPYISLLRILRIRSKDEFLSLYAGTPLMRAGFEQMVRNACAVVGNTKVVEAIPELEFLSKNSESLLIREASVRSLERL